MGSPFPGTPRSPRPNNKPNSTATRPGTSAPTPRPISGGNVPTIVSKQGGRTAARPPAPNRIPPNTTTPGS